MGRPPSYDDTDQLAKIKNRLAMAEDDGCLPAAFYVAVGFDDVQWMIKEIERLRENEYAGWESAMGEDL